MPAGIGYASQRPFVHPRRLTNVREILQDGRKRTRKPRKPKSKRPALPSQTDLADPVARMAWNLHRMRRQKYLAEITNQIRRLGGE